MKASVRGGVRRGGVAEPSARACSSGGGSGGRDGAATRVRQREAHAPTHTRTNADRHKEQRAREPRRPRHPPSPTAAPSRKRSNWLAHSTARTFDADNAAALHDDAVRGAADAPDVVAVENVAAVERHLGHVLGYRPRGYEDHVGRDSSARLFSRHCRLSGHVDLYRVRVCQAAEPFEHLH
jgi:hypothetical protein